MKAQSLKMVKEEKSEGEGKWGSYASKHIIV